MENNIYLNEALRNLEEIREHRRDFHKHAELGFNELRTAKKVEEYLKKLNLAVKTGVAGTGVVGLLRCKEVGKTAALRADMDALPMQEKNDVPYVVHTRRHTEVARVAESVGRCISSPRRASDGGGKGNLLGHGGV